MKIVIFCLGFGFLQMLMTEGTGFIDSIFQKNMGIPRSSIEELYPVDGNWICGSCGNDNGNWTIICGRCGRTK